MLWSWVKYIYNWLPYYVRTLLLTNWYQGCHAFGCIRTPFAKQSPFFWPIRCGDGLFLKSMVVNHSQEMGKCKILYSLTRLWGRVAYTAAAKVLEYVKSSYPGFVHDSHRGFTNPPPLSRTPGCLFRTWGYILGALLSEVHMQIVYHRSTEDFLGRSRNMVTQ